MRIIPGILILLPLASQAATSGGQVTFNRQIAPIIYQNCSGCHHPGEAAPFSLLSYQDVSKKAKTIAKVTASHVMPPWKAETASYAYRDERRLKDTDIALIQQWIQNGMPEGNAADKPELPKFASGWKLGEPDLVLEMPAAYHVPADGPDIYRNMAVASGLTEDKWITAIDMHPSARLRCITCFTLGIQMDASTKNRSKALSQVLAACARAEHPFRWAVGQWVLSRIFFPKAWR